jgi:hypothetical protein
MKQEQRIVALAEILGEAIQGLGRVPNGHLYARVMGKIDLGDYNEAIKVLKDAGLVKEAIHVLKWIGSK